MLGPCAVVPYDEQAYWIERYAGQQAYRDHTRFVAMNPSLLKIH